MPTYQYACTDCGEQLEAVQSFTDEPLTACPACGGRLRKVFSAVGVVFRGSGFYRTDSRAAAARKDGAAASAGKDGAPDTKAPDTKAPDTKAPATTSGSKPKSETSKAGAA